MGLTTVTGAEAIRTEFEGPVVESVFYNDELLGLTRPDGSRLWEVLPNQPGTQYAWQIHTAAAGVAATYSENDPHPDAGSETYANVALDYTYIWYTLDISGRVEDSLIGGHFDLINDYQTLAIQGMTDLFTTTFLNDSTVGLVAAIDDANTYAGLARGSVSYFESTVQDAGNGAVTLDDFSNVVELQEQPAKMGKTGLWLFPREQIRNYAALADFSNNNRREVVMSGGKGFDLGYNWDAMGHDNKPIKQMHDLTNTVILGLDTRPGNFKLVVRRPYRVRQLAPTGDNTRYECTMALGNVVRAPARHVKIEYATA